MGDAVGNGVIGVIVGRGAGLGTIGGAGLGMMGGAGFGGTGGAGFAGTGGAGFGGTGGAGFAGTGGAGFGATGGAGFVTGGCACDPGAVCAETDNIECTQSAPAAQALSRNGQTSFVFIISFLLRFVWKSHFGRMESSSMASSSIKKTRASPAPYHNLQIISF